MCSFGFDFFDIFPDTLRAEIVNESMVEAAQAVSSKDKSTAKKTRKVVYGQASHAEEASEAHIRNTPVTSELEQESDEWWGGGSGLETQSMGDDEEDADAWRARKKLGAEARRTRRRGKSTAATAAEAAANGAA